MTIELERRAFVQAGVALAVAAAAAPAAAQTPAPAGPKPMTFDVKPMPFDPTKIKGLSEKILTSHYANNYTGATTIPQLLSPQILAKEVADVAPQLAAASTGAGTGSANSPGAGPGSGGGVGSGEGTGRGSSVGPGTGGGPGKDYPPTVRDLFIPPMPAPQAVKGFHMKAFFDVDEKGNAKLIGFNPTRDGDYNKRVAEVLRAMRFRPGVHPDGTPKRDTAEIEIIF